MGLMELAPEVQEAILEADPVEVGVRGVTERRVGRLCSLPPAEQSAAIGIPLDRAMSGTQATGVGLTSVEDSRHRLGGRPRP